MEKYFQLWNAFKACVFYYFVIYHNLKIMVKVFQSIQQTKVSLQIFVFRCIGYYIIYEWNDQFLQMECTEFSSTMFLNKTY